MGCIAAGYADEFEVKGHWHFANSDENRVRLASFWTATLFLIDCTANAWGVGLELGQLAQQPHDDLRWNPGFLFQNSAEAESTSSAEEVALRQPDTEDLQDVKNLDPTMIPSQPAGPPPNLATGDVAPPDARRAEPTVTVTTQNIQLKSKAPPALPSASSGSDWPQATARPAQEHERNFVRAYFMEEHLPEYEYTMVTNSESEGNEVNGVGYELELMTATDVETLVRTLRVDRKFQDFATRVNKVCRGIANCSKVKMDKQLF